MVLDREWVESRSQPIMESLLVIRIIVLHVVILLLGLQADARGQLTGRTFVPNSEPLSDLKRVASPATASSVQFAEQEVDSRRPNIVVLFADDQRADTIGAHGNPHIQTPNLDQLASAGFSFRKNYCAGSYSGAVCVASRAMLMTGQHWRKIKNRKSWEGLETFPELLAEDGYRTFVVGKWHNGKKTLAKTFQSGKSVFMGGMADHTKVPLHDLNDRGELVNSRVSQQFSSTEFANAAIEFVDGQKSGQPFLLYVAFTAPHDPRNPPEEFREKYYQNRPPLPDNFLPVHPFRNTLKATGGRDEGLAPTPRTREVVSDQLCEYYGLVTQLDQQVGRVLTAIQNSPQAENTIIIYTADHGLAIGSHGLLGKQNVYEHSMSCPLIIAGPGVPAGGSSSALTYVHDLYATICSFAKVKPSEDVGSKSLSPILKGESAKVRDSVFLPFQNNQLALTDGRWKLHVYPEINHQLLFDLKEDPGEKKDLANSPEHRGDLLAMTEMMKQWKTRLGDDSPLTSADPLPKAFQINEDGRVLDVWQPDWIREKYFDGRNRTNHGSKRLRGLKSEPPNK